MEKSNYKDSMFRNTECISEGILTDFLKRNRAEAMKVSIYEYNEEQHKE